MPQSDPVWAPVAGVTLDCYAVITAALIVAGVSGAEAIDRFVTSHYDTPPGAWAAVRAEWIARMGQHRAVRARYATAFADALARVH